VQRENILFFPGSHVLTPNTSLRSVFAPSLLKQRGGLMSVNELLPPLYEAERGIRGGEYVLVYFINYR